MAGIDSKIVSMKFDNQAFQAKVAETLKSIDKLNNGMNFTSSAESIKQLDSAAKGFDLSSMSKSVEGVSAKFVALSTIAITALSNITGKVIDAGIRWTKALTLDPVAQGFGEFELKMGAIQTIMAGSGASLSEVNTKLNELNTYADRTIYSFSDMTSNIGKFTNAGVSLDDSVGAIQGVANVAALAGANSGEASRAMYNFAQALSTGSVKLIDWKSIELANMGTVEFKDQIIDTAIAMGTLNKASDGTITTLEGTEVTAKNFNTTLQDAWFTSDVLTTVLGKFSDTTTDVGKRASKAATEIKTFSQMVDTMKEAVGSGWAMSFEHIFGDFEEGKELWTSINAGFESIVVSGADARNRLLKGWKTLGGRDLLITGLGNAVKGLGSVLAPIKDAFRDIFPPMTAHRLMDLTESFARFTEKLTVSGSTANKIKSIFSGVFSIFKIGWEVIKGVAGVIGDLVGSLSGVGGGALGFLANIGDAITALQEALVAGGGIADFFDNIGEAVKKPGKFLDDLRKNFRKLFDDFPGGKDLLSFFDNLAARAGALGAVAEAVGDVWNWLSDRLSGIRGVLDEVWGHISTWFGELATRLGEIFKPSDFNGAVDAVNVGLLGGIGLMLKRFFKNGIGFNFDFGGGMFKNIKQALEGVTGSLKAMQADLRAKALMKIAIAVGVLAVSLLLLATIDPAKLAVALGAVTVAMGQLIGAMALMEKISLGTGAVKLVAVGSAMIALAVAVGILSLAIKNLSSLGWAELAKGLIGVSVGLGAMVLAVNSISGVSGGLIRAGVGMIGMSLGILALSYAVKSFSDLSWGELAKGMVGVTVGLHLLTAAMQLMPKTGMFTAGLGMIAISAGLIVLSKAVESFAAISWGEMAKGFVGVGVGLGIIAGAMKLMPKGMLVQSVALVVLSGALLILARAVESMGSIPFGEMAKGIGALAAMLVILSFAMVAMSGTAAGAASLLIVSGALLVLVEVIRQIGGLSIAEIVTGLVTMAATFAVLGGAALLLTPVMPMLFSLGAALALLGAGFALFGVGASMLAGAFQIIAQSGKAGLGVLLEMIKMGIAALPAFVEAFVNALVQLVVAIVEAAPKLLAAFTELMTQILDTIIELAPKIGETLVTVISTFLTMVQELIPEFVELGFAILMGLLTGVRDNIGEIVTTVAEIITGFIDALTEKVPEIVDSVYTFLMTVIEEVATKIGEGAGSFTSVGQALIDGFVKGLEETAPGLLDWFRELPGKILDIIKGLLGINSPSTVFAALGGDLIKGLLKGLVSTIGSVITWFTKLPGNILKWIGNVGSTLLRKGIDFITGLLKGITDKAREVISWFGALAGNVVRWVGNLINTLKTKGIQVISGLLNGITERWRAVTSWLGNIGSRISSAVSGVANALVGVGRSVIDGFKRGMSNAWGSVTSWIADKASSLPGFIKGPLGIKSPSRVFMAIGENVMDGLAVAFRKDRAAENGVSDVADRVKSSFERSIRDLYSELDALDIGDLNPVITPVLDLTRVRAEARNLEHMIDIPAINPDVTYGRARHIATATAASRIDDAEATASVAPSEIKFEQHNYSPRALSTVDIYRNTNSQIALAKEELNIPS